MDDLEYVIGPDGELLYLREFVDALKDAIQEQIERDRLQMQMEALTPWKAAADEQEAHNDQ